MQTHLSLQFHDSKPQLQLFLLNHPLPWQLGISSYANTKPPLVCLVYNLCLHLTDAILVNYLWSIWFYRISNWEYTLDFHVKRNPNYRIAWVLSFICKFHKFRQFVNVVLFHPLFASNEQSVRITNGRTKSEPSLCMNVRMNNLRILLLFTKFDDGAGKNLTSAKHFRAKWKYMLGFLLCCEYQAEQFAAKYWRRLWALYILDTRLSSR